MLSEMRFLDCLVPDEFVLKLLVQEAVVLVTRDEHGIISFIIFVIAFIFARGFLLLIFSVVNVQEPCAYCLVDKIMV